MKNFRSSNNHYYTRQLFWEEWINLPIEQRVAQPLFSLHYDKPDLVNFGKRYIELRDPTGYQVAQELLDGYLHWTVLSKCRWFQAAKAVWDQELDAALTSEGIATIQELAKDGMPAQRLAAAKFLANKEYKKDKSAGKGRPSRDLVDQEAKRMAASERDIMDDLKRIQGAKG